MATYQQRIALKGSESTIADFTNLLRDVKDLFSINSAEVITNAIKHWRENGYKTLQDKSLSLNLVTKYFSELCTYNTRIFHLQLLTSAETMSNIQTDIDRLKRDSTLKSAIEMYGIGPYSRGGADFQLAALILVLEYYKLSSSGRTTKAYTELINAKKPPLPNSSSIKSYLPSNDEPTTSLMQNKHTSPLRSSENYTSYLRNENSITSPVSSPYRNQMSIDREENTSSYEPRYRRGHSCLNFDQNTRTNFEDQEKSKYLVSWRTRIREQQLAENRRLNDAVRSSISCSRESTPVNNIDLQEKIKSFRNWRSNTPSTSNASSWRNNLSIYDKSPTARNTTDKESYSSQNILSETNSNRAPIKRSINYDHPQPEWTLVHQTDMRKRALGLSDENIESKAAVTCNARNSENKENDVPNVKEKDSPLIKRRYELDVTNNHATFKGRQASEPPKTLPKVESTISSPINTSMSRIQKEVPVFKLNIDLDILSDLVLSIKERKSRSEKVTSAYLMVDPPDKRNVPGFTEPLTNGERMRHSIDCDEVYPNIILGNGATLRKKKYLKEIGITYILNAAESRGVNVGKEYFGDDYQYMGLKIEDTPQTQICR